MTYPSTIKALFITCVSILCTKFVKAQDAPVENLADKVYWSTGADFATLSTAFGSKSNEDAHFGTPRFSMINIASYLHIDFAPKWGIYTGIGIKNIGFIEKYKNPDSTVKRRVYTIGVPLALKYGNMEMATYWFAGGGIDIPFNFREKGFVKRSNKVSFNEWFSDRTPKVMPYVMAGYNFHPGVSLKLQYYLTNFLNTNYEQAQAKPYNGYNVHLLLFSVGFVIPYFNRF